MRLVFLADIQANLPALDSVLAEVDKKPVDAIVHVGNVVGHGPFPVEVIARLRARGIEGVRGDLDDRVARGAVRQAIDDAENDEIAQAACRWTHAQLANDDRDWLARLPFLRTLGTSATRVAVFHAHPVAIDRPLHDGLADDRFREVGEYTGASVNVFAHTGEPFWRVVDGRWYVNAGSVGATQGADARASFAVIEVNGGASVRIARVDYDREATAAAARNTALPSGALRILGVA